MALVVPGQSKCPICGKTIQSGYVCFGWFEGADVELARVSDAACHYQCVVSHPKHKDLAAIFLSQLGEDGQRPNGTRVLTVNQNTRISFGPNIGVRVAQTPLFVTLEMPEATAESWRESDFWSAFSKEGHCQFLDRGFSLHIEVIGEECLLTVEVCPHSFFPNQCPRPDLVRKVARTTTTDIVAAFLRDCQDALRSL